jgi:hypothetical protein
MYGSVPIKLALKAFGLLTEVNLTAILLQSWISKKEGECPPLPPRDIPP